MFRHFDRLKKLKRNDVTIVIHDPGEISHYNEPYLKYWNIITIRKSMQNFLQVGGVIVEAIIVYILSN
jgi:hypothetical protein